jgi:hypothetical protein
LLLEVGQASVLAPSKGKVGKVNGFSATNPERCQLSTKEMEKAKLFLRRTARLSEW